MEENNNNMEQNNSNIEQNNNNYEDITIVCKDCGNEFVFSAGEQSFYAQKGFTNAPVRCATCRRARKNAMNNN